MATTKLLVAKNLARDICKSRPTVLKFAMFEACIYDFPCHTRHHYYGHHEIKLTAAYLQ